MCLKSIICANTTANMGWKSCVIAILDIFVNSTRVFNNFDYLSKKRYNI